VTCVNDPTGLPSVAGGGGIPGGPTVGHPFNPEVPAPEIGIGVTAPAGEGTISEANRVSVAGGGALGAASARDQVTVAKVLPPFGFADADAWFSNANGTLDTQAGSHPYEASFVFDLNKSYVEEGFYKDKAVGGELRNLTFNLPPGFVGDPYAVPMCTQQQFATIACPADSQVGVIQAYTLGYAVISSHGERQGAPVYNLVPPAGAHAEFGFEAGEVNTLAVTNLKSGSNYALATHVNNIAQRDVLGSVLTLWGEPGNASHGLWHLDGAGNIGETPFLTLPTSCEGAQEYSVSTTSWEDPEAEPAHIGFVSHNATDDPFGFTGCEELAFDPSLTAAPDTSNADTPAGLTVEVKPPLGGLFEAEGVGSSDIKESTVTLPPGVVINPGQAAGLQACQYSESGIGVESTSEEPTKGEPTCPKASKVGTDEITTPILKNTLKGNVYVLQSEPPEVKLLIAASGEGVDVKLVGNVNLNKQTGQLTTTVTTGLPAYPHVPQAPVSNFKLSFSGGAQAALDTPTRCGTYTTQSTFVPWGSPLVAEASPTSSFGISSGPGGGACPGGALPFTPTLTAGATTDQAGGFTDFSLLLQRPDGQQRISGLQFKAPEGLTGFLSKVPLCTNAQAETNTCPEASKIGHTIVESGPGPYPLVVPEPGQEPAPIYLTESYGGAPFGLSIVVPLHVGPFVLPTQRVRAKIEVDPYTSALTITTNELPQEVAGVPTDLREIDAVVERPEFMVNPTNCNPQSFTGTAYGTAPPGQNEPNTSAPISSHFGVGACRALEFAPKFSVSTSGKTSKSQGASLTAKVTYPYGPQGTYADVANVKVELPKQLPSRLTTLQKACTDAQFEANPAGCPSASMIGYATVHTPLLPVPLVGPAIFVSHGGEAFPSLTMVLQGDGVKVDLVGATFISKAGITSTTFKTVPDDPFSSFELTLPEGKYSALGTNYNLCKLTTVKTVSKKVTIRVHGHKQTVTRRVKQTKPAALEMPNEFVGQNGTVIKQTTKISVTGCPKAHRAKPASKHGKAGKRKG
jgi:hypothetical protein